MKSIIKSIEPCYGTTYIRHINGLYLGMKEGSLALSNERFLWRVESFENNRFFLKEISDHDLAEYWYGKFQVAVDSGYAEQHWHIYQKEQNVIIEHADSHMFLFASNNGLLVLNDGINDNDGYYFRFEDSSLTKGYPYLKLESNTGKIDLRFEHKILNIVNNDWLSNWINDLERAVYSLNRLVGDLPFPKFEIRTYTNCNSWGYIFYGKPIIHINNKDFENEIIRMRKLEKRDISFGTLHEISHLFDHASWIFDGEATANMKIPFVLNELNFNVSLSRHQENETFTYDNYVQELYKEHGRLDDVKGLFSSALAAKLTEIAKVLGWDVFKQAFRNFPNMEKESSMSRFETFINKLSEYSATNAKEMFSNEEWQTIINNLS